MSSDDLISTGDYSDYNILDEEKDPISKKMILSGSKQKINIERKSTVNSLQKKQRGS